ncbi:uncharacterized protein METZ01_LOCUS439207, partial [marine metagenome]
LSKRPNILVIGVGSIGERHLRCFKSTDRCDMALCETLLDRRDGVAMEYGVAGYASIEEALDAQSFDAAIIAVPAPFHVPLATQLTGHGLHLLIEKPLATTLEGVTELLQLI